MKDFNSRSFRRAVAPLAIYMRSENRYTYSNILVKITGDEVQRALGHIEEAMGQFSPGYPFVYQFLDDVYNDMYAREARLGTLFSYFTIIALFIACMGLLGLAAFIAEGRKKEIGIRKVMGASTAQILLLLSGQFARLVVIAFAVAVPIGYISLSRWLEGFAYKVPLGWLTFFVAGISVLLIAILTVSYQSFRAARANPAQTLKYA